MPKTDQSQLDTTDLVVKDFHQLCLSISNAKNLDDLKYSLSKLSLSGATLEEDLDSMKLKELVSDLFNSPKKDKDKQQEYAKLLVSYARHNAIENGRFVQSTLSATDQTLSLKVRDNLIEEYGAESFSDKMIVDLLVSAYFRAMRSSHAYNLVTQRTDGRVKMSSSEITKLIRELNRTMSEANSQVLSLITHLKQRKQPPLKVSIKTDNAYLAQNQQFNQSP